MLVVVQLHNTTPVPIASYCEQINYRLSKSLIFIEIISLSLFFIYTDNNGARIKFSCIVKIIIYFGVLAFSHGGIGHG